MTKFLIGVLSVAVAVTQVDLLSLEDGIKFIGSYCGSGTFTEDQVKAAVVCGKNYAAKNLQGVNVSGFLGCLGDPGKESKTLITICKNKGVPGDKVVQCALGALGGIDGLGKIPKEKTDQITKDCVNY